MREQDVLEQAMEYVREAFREDYSGQDFFML